MPKQRKRNHKTARNTHKPHQKPPQGHVAYRLLCHHQPGTAVIGHGGSVSQQISYDTGISNLYVEDTLPGCDERIVYVVGPGMLDRSFFLRDDGGGGEREFEVSAAQVALFRVFEIIEANSAAKIVRCCRLLTVKAEEKIKSLGGISGASIRVLPPEEHPLCAEISDDLIQITGDSLAVRKALLAVTYCLQGNMSKAVALVSQFRDSVSDGGSHKLHAQKHPSLDTDAGDGGQSSMVVGTNEVAFSLLCPTYAADNLIDWGGSLMKALKRETGARIEVLGPVLGCDECVIMISAMENMEWQYSPAQEATLRVFTRLMKAASESGSKRRECVTARLLISISQANMLDMKDTAGADVQIFEGQCTPAASVGKKIIQIVGEYSDVHTCLLQITWKLRESMLSSIKIDQKIGPPLLPHVLYGLRSHIHAASTIANKMDNLAISHESNISLSSRVRPSESLFGNTPTTSMENQCNVMASISSSELGSGDQFAVIRSEELEVLVPVHVFRHIYGEDGVNLARLRQISGATIIVRDPCAGTDGKVIIRGTPTQTLAAKNMLYGLIMDNHDCVIIK